MPELNVEAKDTDTDGAVPKPLTASRLAVLCAAGLGGGVAGIVVFGALGTLSGGALSPARHDATFDALAAFHSYLGALVGTVLGIPLGIALGLRAAGTRIGIRGRFWPAIGASFAGTLASIGLAVFLMYLVNRPHMGRAVGAFSPFLLYAAPFVLSLVGGLVGYLGGRPKRPDDRASDY